jgi:hypothetical protein
MKLNLSKMAVKELDLVDFSEKFKEIINKKGLDSTSLYQFLMDVIPVYEATKRKLVAEALEAGARQLIDWIWDDPMDPTPYSRLDVLKNLAKELNITIDEDGRTN